MRGTAAALVLVAALASGCGPAGSAMERRVELPAGFPADVPLPEQSVLRVSQDLGRQGLNVIFESRRGVPEAAARQRELLAAAGWRLIGEAQVDDGVFLSYRKDRRALALGVSRGRDATAVSMAYAELPRAGAEGDHG
jgi:hypothetical protein